MKISRENKREKKKERKKKKEVSSVARESDRRWSEVECTTWLLAGSGHAPRDIVTPGDDVGLGLPSETTPRLTLTDRASSRLSCLRDTLTRG